MRIALVGWEIDEAVAIALEGLGTEVTAFTRWFPETPRRVALGGGALIRCPHQVGGGVVAEAWSFRDSVLRQASETGIGMTFDVVHALDPLARPAAAGLRERSPGATAVVGSITPSDLSGGDEAGLTLDLDAARWVADHPWLAERWRDQTPGGVRARPAVVLRSQAERPGLSGSMEVEARGPVVALWAPRDAAIDPAGIVEAIGQARAAAGGLGAIVLGTGPIAESLRRRLAGRGWLVPEARRGAGEMTLERWRAWLARAAVVGVPAEALCDDPTARISWLHGVPVVSIAGGAAPEALAGAIADLLFNPGRRERQVRAGEAIARRDIGPEAVALGWLRVYLDALSTPRRSPRSEGPSPSAAWSLAAARSRLSLVPISPREVYAAWTVRPDDWTAALEWLGDEAPRAALTIRMLDITDLQFDGGDATAHSQWDIDPGLTETSRTLSVAFPGRSVAARLGVRTPRGVFLPLAHARPCHLPREALAPSEPVRRLRVLPGRGRS